MSERNLRALGAGLLLAGAVACGLQILISLVWLPSAVPFIVTVSGPQLLAGVWVLLPWGVRRAVRYLPPIVLCVYVAFWNTAILAEGSTGPPLPPLVFTATGVLLATQVVLTLIAAVLLGLAWRVGRRSRPDTSAG